MIHKEDILDAIAECEGQRNPSVNTCLKLAAFYTILEHMEKEDEDMKIVPVLESPKYSFAAAEPGKIEYRSDSEFGKVVNGQDADKVLATFDELMTTLQEMIPKLYAGVLDRLR